MSGLEVDSENRTARYSAQLKRITPPHGIVDYLRSHAITFAIANQYRLGAVVDPLPVDSNYQGMLAIPYLTPGGVKAVKYRCVADHACDEHRHGKYSAPKGQRVRIYNTAAYFSAGDTIGVCEGEIDAIVATEKLGLPTLGVPGALQWRAHQVPWRLALADFEQVVIFADGDDAGQSFADDVAESVGAGALIVRCLPGYDVARTVAENKTDELLRRMP